MNVPSSLNSCLVACHTAPCACVSCQKNGLVSAPDERPNEPQLQAQLSQLTDRSRLRRLKETLLSKGAWQQVTRIEDLCHTQVSHKWLYYMDACAGSVLTPHGHITNVRNPERSPLRNPGRLMFLPPLLSPDVVRPRTCVCPPLLQRQLAETPPHAAFDRKLPHYKNEIVLPQGIHCRPLIWTAEGPPHPAVMRTLQYAADIASCRNGQQMSAESLQCRWKHESKSLSCGGGQPWRAQFCRIRRRERSGSSLESLIDHCTTGDTSLPLDGGPRDHDLADNETNTTKPDDDDIASLASYHRGQNNCRNAQCKIICFFE